MFSETSLFPGILYVLTTTGLHFCLLNSQLKQAWALSWLCTENADNPNGTIYLPHFGSTPSFSSFAAVCLPDSTGKKMSLWGHMCSFHRKRANFQFQIKLKATMFKQDSNRLLGTLDTLWETFWSVFYGFYGMFISRSRLKTWPF